MDYEEFGVRPSNTENLKGELYGINKGQIGSCISGLRPEEMHLTGLHTGFSDTLVLDAGVLYINVSFGDMYNDYFAPGAFEKEIKPQKLGATGGGTKINIGKKMRQVEADGRRTKLKGLQRLD